MMAAVTKFQHDCSPNFFRSFLAALGATKCDAPAQLTMYPRFSPLPRAGGSICHLRAVVATTLLPCCLAFAHWQAVWVWIPAFYRALSAAPDWASSRDVAGCDDAKGPHWYLIVLIVIRFSAWAGGKIDLQSPDQAKQLISRLEFSHRSSTN